MLLLAERARYVGSPEHKDTPWAQGYACARELRRQLGIEDYLIRDMHDFSTCLRVDGQALQDVILSANGTARFFDALVDVNEKGSPGS